MATDGLSVRKLSPGEEDAFERSVRVPFLDPPTGDPDMEAEIRRGVAALQTDRAWVADAGDRFVGQCSIDTLDLSVPSRPGGECPTLPMAGITSVGVHPTHRRRGLLRQMMDEMISDARGRGEPIAGLIASEASIYGRFGFGHATDRVELTIETAHSAFSSPAPDAEIRLVDPARAGPAMSEIYERYRSTRPGDISRRSHTWESILADPPHRRRGGRACSSLFAMEATRAIATTRATSSTGCSGGS